MQYLLPCALILVLIAVLAAMPWSRPHPNHLFMLDLLSTALGDETTDRGCEPSSRQLD